MKILLLNDNPVVNKLVTLSAQKTSDDLEIVNNIESISDAVYDLLVVDDTLYTNDLVANLKNKITFKKSLYICARDALPADEFTKIIKKPFLPTDLVELFSSIGKEIDEISLNEELNKEEISFEPNPSDLGEFNQIEDELFLDEELNLEEELDFDKDPKNILDIDELKEVQDLLDDTELEANIIDNLNLDKELGFDSESEEIEEVDLDTNLDLEEELVLDDEELKSESEEIEEVDLDTNLDLEEELALDDEELKSESEEIEEVDLDTNLDLEEELALDDEKLKSESEEIEEIDLGGNLDLEEELAFDDEELKSEEIEEIDLGGNLDLEEELVLDDEELKSESEDLSVDDDLNIEAQIMNAVSELSQEDLDSEIDEKTLVDMDTREVNSIDSLNSRDLKIAFGEEVTEVEGILSDKIDNVLDLEISSDNEGVVALQKLLGALLDKDVAASMKGMKININIELGDLK